MIRGTCKVSFFLRPFLFPNSKARNFENQFAQWKGRESTEKPMLWNNRGI